MRLEITPRAQADIREIAEFSVEQFGDVTGKTYLAGLRVSFSRLQEYPQIGSAIYEDRKGRRLFQYRSHFIYYRIEKKCIVIVRVLHKARDFKRLLR